VVAGVEGSDLKVFRKPTKETVPICTDLERLTQVFINLISNVLKYAVAENPELRIIVRSQTGQTFVDFCDNGPGIPKESQSMIFEKFSRLEDARMAGGAGLGLAICKQIMAALGGDVAYLPGQGGAAFRVTLPSNG